MAQLHVLACKAIAGESVEVDQEKFDAVKKVLPREMQDLLSAQGRLLIVAETVDSTATQAQAK